MSERRRSRGAEEPKKAGAQRAPASRRKAAANSAPTAKGGVAKAGPGKPGAGKPSPGKGGAGVKGGAQQAPANAPKSPISPTYESGADPAQPGEVVEERDRGLRRAMFLAELAEARELRRRVAPRRAKAQEMHARLLRTFRY